MTADELILLLREWGYPISIWVTDRGFQVNVRVDDVAFMVNGGTTIVEALENCYKDIQHRPKFKPAPTTLNLEDLDL